MTNISFAKQAYLQVDAGIVSAVRETEAAKHFAPEIAAEILSRPNVETVAIVGNTLELVMHATKYCEANSSVQHINVAEGAPRHVREQARNLAEFFGYSFQELPIDSLARSADLIFADESANALSTAGNHFPGLQLTIVLQQGCASDWMNSCSLNPDLFVIDELGGADAFDAASSSITQQSATTLGQILNARRVGRTSQTQFTMFVTSKACQPERSCPA